ncbi:MAG: hypothetical protein P8J27_10225 [Mariniblastus sp.]|nr:hypothetical protein [Mariniblastus sp.]
MFLPPKLTTILLGQIMAVTVLLGTADGQQVDFERRLAAMQEARMRAQAPAQVEYVASTDIGIDFADPPAPPSTRVASKTQPAQDSGTQRAILGVPRNLVRTKSPLRPKLQSRQGLQTPPPANDLPQQRVAQLTNETFIEGGSPVMSSPMESTVVGCASCGQANGCMGGDCGGGIVMEGGCVDGECSSCNSCGVAGGYFQGQCCGRGGCPPGSCWITGLGQLFYHGEYFGGATSFRSQLFDAPGTTTGDLANDNSHGFYGGVNVGLPLCRLSCGLFSGQVGVRAVQTNFNGSEFSPSSRSQMFVTAGIFRRVDYGLQAGVVADILHEEWFSDSDLVQIRGDLGWVSPSGSTMGFRFATNVQDDVNSGIFNGNPFAGLVQSTENTYRFYYRKDCELGYGEGFLGWTDSNQTILGMDYDMSLGDRLALQAGFTYYLNDDGVPAGTNVQGGNAAEAFNVFVGFAFRPRGVAHYRSYDRPMFSVADNGSMLITRE